MNILYWHGYLLNGSGSNIYALNVVKELSKTNNVFLFSQEKELLEGFDEHWSYDSNLDISKVELTTSKNNKLVNVNPYIGDLLPVFVKDTYKDFTVKTFPELSSSELENYINLNVDSLKKFLKENNIDIIFCNHLAISPYIMKLATKDLGIPYIVIGHGSSLNYTIALDDRYKELSSKGLEDSRKIVFQSDYFYKRTLEVYNSSTIDSLLKEKAVTIPCGINHIKFSNILSPTELLKLIDQAPKDGYSIKDSEDFHSLGNRDTVGHIMGDLKNISSKVDSFSSLDRDLHKKLESKNNSPIIAFVGRFIYSKGPHLFLLTLPYIFKEFPGAKILLIGSGKLRGVLEVMISALKNQNLSLLLSLSKEGQKLEEGSNYEELFYFKNFIENLIKTNGIEDYLKLASNINMDQIIFTGNLSHNILPTVLSEADVLVVPSIFPESFGMIAIEGMFLGNVPITFDHSGLSEVVPLSENKVLFNKEAVSNLATATITNCKNNISKEKKDFFKNFVKNFSYEKICKTLMESSV